MKSSSEAVRLPQAAVSTDPNHTATFSTRLFAPLLDSRGNVSRPKLLLAVALSDFAAVTLTGIAAFRAHGATTLSVAPLVAIAVALLVGIALKAQWSYSVASLNRLAPQIAKVCLSAAGVLLIVGGAFYLSGSALLPRLTLAQWLATSTATLVVIRWAASAVVDDLTQAGRLVRRTVIVGGGKDADDLIEAFRREGNSALQILGVFDDRSGDRAVSASGQLTHLGTFAQLAQFCRNEGVDLLIVTVPQRAEQRLLAILRQLFTLQIDIRVSALGSDLRLNSSSYRYIGKVPMLPVMDKPLSDWDRVVKNLEDRLLGLALIVLTAPVMACVALAVKLTSKGPVLFRQKRYGFNNELIEVYKFRSMYTDMSDATAAKLVTRDDPRVTPVGRFIRRTSLDELPQLLNVLRGEMSLVGPRPHAVQAKAERDLYEEVVQGYFARHRVKPGVTGWAQINGWRGETDTHEKLIRRVEHDLYYIDNWSLLLDLYIIAATPISLVTTKNAY
ncbi:MAG: undecaprenyl-phosphate glucose phosphotransferase [Hyphomicrobiaceae bacterium]|nr:undecaprenyl-phosphate glucose phosphotransferase [Hyphomicrobiaceae bacterium]